MNALATITPDMAPSRVTMGFNSQAGFELMQRGAKLLASSSLVPEEFRGNLPNCVIAINMAQRLGADPLLVMQNLYVVYGRPGWSSQFLIATFNQCGRFTAMRFAFVGTPGKEDYGCYAWATEKATGDKIVGTTITIAMANAEGWLTKKGSKWKTMPQQMLTYRAASFLVRAYAPELSMGLQTADELTDIGYQPGAAVTAAAREPELVSVIERELAGDVPEAKAAPSADAKAEAPDAARDDEDGPPITAQDVHDALVSAATRYALDEAASTITMLPEPEQMPLTALYQQRLTEVEQ